MPIKSKNAPHLKLTDHYPYYIWFCNKLLSLFKMNSNIVLVKSDCLSVCRYNVLPPPALLTIQYRVFNQRIPCGIIGYANSADINDTIKILNQYARNSQKKKYTTYFTYLSICAPIVTVNGFIVKRALSVIAIIILFTCWILIKWILYFKCRKYVAETIY